MSVEASASSTPELAWFTSSYSAGNGGECVEVALTWRTSSYSSGEGGECVEVATCPHTIHVRDSKRPTHSTLTFDAAPWADFVAFAARR